MESQTRHTQLCSCCWTKAICTGISGHLPQGCTQKAAPYTPKPLSQSSTALCTGCYPACSFIPRVGYCSWVEWLGRSILQRTKQSPGSASCTQKCSVQFLSKIITRVKVTDLYWTCWNKTTYSYVVLQVAVKLMSALRAFLVCTNKFLS